MAEQVRIECDNCGKYLGTGLPEVEGVFGTVLCIACHNEEFRAEEERDAS